MPPILSFAHQFAPKWYPLLSSDPQAFQFLLSFALPLVLSFSWRLLHRRFFRFHSCRELARGLLSLRRTRRQWFQEVFRIRQEGRQGLCRFGFRLLHLVGLTSFQGRFGLWMHQRWSWIPLSHVLLFQSHRGHFQFHRLGDTNRFLHLVLLVL